MRARTGSRRLLADLSPLQDYPAYRRLWVGLTLGNVGQIVAITAIGLQVYAITSSSFAVGLAGFCGLFPLVLLGLYGGAIVDAHDRLAYCSRTGRPAALDDPAAWRVERREP